MFLFPYDSFKTHDKTNERLSILADLIAHRRSDLIVRLDEPSILARARLHGFIAGRWGSSFRRQPRQAVAPRWSERRPVAKFISEDTNPSPLRLVPHHLGKRRANQFRVGSFGQQELAVVLAVDRLGLTLFLVLGMNLSPAHERNVFFDRHYLREIWFRPFRLG